MFGLDLVTATIQRVFRAEARSAVLAGTLEGIADGLEQIMGERPSLEGAVIVEMIPSETPKAITTERPARKAAKKAGFTSVEVLFVVATAGTVAACVWM